MFKPLFHFLLVHKVYSLFPLEPLSKKSTECFQEEVSQDHNFVPEEEELR